MPTPMMLPASFHVKVKDLVTMQLSTELAAGVCYDHWTLNHVAVFGLTDANMLPYIPLSVMDNNQKVLTHEDSELRTFDFAQHLPSPTDAAPIRHLLVKIRPAEPWLPEADPLSAVKMTMLFRDGTSRGFLLYQNVRWEKGQQYEVLLGNPPGKQASDAVAIGLTTTGLQARRVQSISVRTFAEQLPRWISEADDAMAMMSNWTKVGCPDNHAPQVVAEPMGDPAPAEVFSRPPLSPWCTGQGVGFGTDAGGLSTYGPRMAEPPLGDVTVVNNTYYDAHNALRDSRYGVSHEFTLSKDGVAHYGMLADFVGTLGQYGGAGERVAAGLNNSAQDFLRTWLRASQATDALKQTRWAIYEVRIRDSFGSIISVPNCEAAQDACRTRLVGINGIVEYQWNCVQGGNTRLMSQAPDADGSVLLHCP